MLTQWFDPEPTFKGLLFAKELVRRGHQVEVLTGFPNYPGGNLYPGYKIKFYQKEEIDGVKIIRVPLYPSHDKSGIGRFFNYISFAFFSALIGLFLVKPADIMYVYHPPATIGIPAIFLRIFRRIPFVYDIQDIWPDTVAATGMLTNSIALKIIGYWCKIVYFFAKHIVVLSPGFKRILIDRGVPPQKIDVIYNWYDSNQILDNKYDENLAKSLGLYGRFNIVFAGNMGAAQALDAVLDAAKLLQDKLSEIQFVFVGDGIDKERLEHKANDMNLSNILFLSRRPYKEIGNILILADALLVHLKDDPLFHITIPSKIQAYLAFGKPIIMGVKGDAADLIKKSGAGLTCEPEKPESIALAVETLYKMPVEKQIELGNKGNQFYIENLSIESGTNKFETIFKSILIPISKSKS